MGCRIRWQLRELAVRHALGAQRRDLVWYVLRQGVAIIVPGFFLGLLGSIVLSRMLSSMLYQVPATDPLTFASVSTGLIGVALLACWIPARQAARMDPLVWLRYD
jgi:putative ABC transport system permease protein